MPERIDVTGYPDPWEITQAVASESTDNIWTRPLGRKEHTWDELRDPYPERLTELRRMPYKEYLETREWQARRRVALSQAREKCNRCGRRRMLHVHHRTYENRGCEKPDDLEVLCLDCHRREHGKTS